MFHATMWRLAEVGFLRILCGNILFAASVFIQIGYAQNPSPDQRGQARQVRDTRALDLRVRFAVSTVRPANSGSGMSLFALSPDGVSITNTPLSQIIRESFGVEEDRVLSIPGWATSKSFDIQAKVDPSDAPELEKMTLEQRRLMLVSILTDRFDLRFHRETRNLPVYALLVAKDVPKVKPVRPKSDSTPAGSLLMTGAGRLESHGCQMKLFANWLSGQVGRVVIDKTGLTDTYYFTFEWTPDEASFQGTAEQDTTSHNEDGAAIRYPSLFKALQEELGLKLEAEHGLTDVIVIDHIGQPSDN